MNLSTITPLIITFNEERNIERVLQRLEWAGRVVVLDSGSDDATVRIARRYPNVDVLHRSFDTFAGQCNFGLDNVNTEWVLSMDADFVPSHALIDELAKVSPSRTDGYRVNIVYCIEGRALRGSLYPPRVVLYRKNSARYKDDGHGHRVRINGRVSALRGVIYHDDRKPLARWLSNQKSYAEQEAAKLLTAHARDLNFADRLRRWRLAPLLTPLYCLVAKGLILDGRAGWRYMLERTYAEVLLALELTHRGQRKGADDCMANE